MEGKKVLIADDEETVRYVVRDMLGQENTVLEAKDGEEAVNITRSQRPDLIIMDIMMPKMDGYTACYTIKKDPITKAIPVVMLTAIDQELNRKLAGQMGADGYMTKPFQLNDLRDLLGRFCPTS
ncbi:MAG: response regulator [Dehalococcoidales bacterium]|nr:response regulator [Dehalococcoidales bacterium]